MARLVEMAVESVRVHMLSNRHVVILKDVERDRYLPIWIGPWEASAIAMKLQGLSAERPLTHDLFVAALERLDVRIDRVVISELAEETYHARLILERGGVELELDARPSDCVALAVRTDVRILVAEAVLEQAALGADPGDEEPGAEGSSRAASGSMGPGVPLETLGEDVVDERLDMFREFINSLDVDPGSSGGGSGGSSGPGGTGGTGGTGGPGGTGGGPGGAGGPRGGAGETGGSGGGRRPG